MTTQAASRPAFMDDDRRWFAAHPHLKARRRLPLPGEFTPEELTAPDGYRLEVLVEKVVEFEGGDSIRMRHPLLVPLGESLQ